MKTDASNARDITVWVVEDNEGYRRTLVRVLNGVPGFKCIFQASSAEQAIQAVPKSPQPNVILMDVELPGISGIEALSRIKPYMPDTTVVIVTAFHDDDKIFKAIMAGASGYLLKTASMDEIINSVREAATGGAPMTPRVAKSVLGMISGMGKVRETNYGLTQRECTILEMMTTGMLKKEIADTLSLSYHTVDSHLRSIYSKLHVNSRSEAVGKALREGVVK